MKIYAYTGIITLLYFNLISCDDNIKCNGTLFFDHLDLTTFDHRQKKLDILSGEEINLICQLDDISQSNGCLASNLTYEFGVRDKPHENSTIQLVNDTMLQLKIKTNKSVDFTVTCLYNGYGLNSIVMSINVGQTPQPIQLQCLMYPEEKLQCEFERSRNPILEEYDIAYLNHSTQPAIYNRAVFNVKNRKRIWELMLPKFEPFGKFSFRVTIKNRFGTLIQNFTFETKQIVVIPNNFIKEIRKVQPKSVVIGIVLNATLKMYEFIYNATACISQCYDDEGFFPVNITDITTESNGTKLNLNLNIALPHAYQTYKLEIKVQIKDAKFPSKQQITVKSKSFNTTASPPEYPPTTFTNGFEIRDQNAVIIYWKEIEARYKNGPEFNYQVSDVYENGVKLSIVKWTALSGSAGRFENWNRNKSYKIRLISRNSEGVSLDRSDIIEIPSATDLVPPPDRMRKTILDDVYDLSWKPSTLHNIISYTIYWCNPQNEIEFTCGFLLGHKILPKYETTFKFNNTINNGMKSFAIVANTKNSSSGLFWFTCPSRRIPEVTHYTNTSITLNWTMSCNSNRKYQLQILYCPNDPHSNGTCHMDKKYQFPTIGQESIVLSKLQRCTSYLIKIFSFYQNATHPIVTIARTADGPPPIPTELSSGFTTNTTIDIFWSMHYECPGTKFYKLIYNNSVPIIFHKSNGSKSYTIQNLTSFSLYSVKLAMCYSEALCSEYSESITVKTKYGTPSEIDELMSNENNEGYVFYTWKPSVQNAKYQYYEVRHTFFQGDQETNLTGVVLNPKCTFVRHPCDDITSNKHFVRVINSDRKINYNIGFKKTEHQSGVCFEEISSNITMLCSNGACLIGDWIKYRDFHCSREKSIMMKFSAVLGVALVCVVGLVAGLAIGVRKYRSIKNVGHLSMPDGLDSIFKLRSKSNINQILEPSIGPNCDEPQEEYCTYDYIFSRSNQLDQISVSDSTATLENQDDYLEYSLNTKPMPDLGNYVKLNDLQTPQKIPTTGYTPISALQFQTLPQPTNEEIQLSKIPNQNGYIPVSAISTITTPLKSYGYIPIPLLHTIKPSIAKPFNGYTPVSALQQQHNSMKLSTFSANGYISVAALQSQTS